MDKSNSSLNQSMDFDRLTSRRILLLAFVGFHLTLVALSAFKIERADLGTLEALIARYTSMSGADNSYSFFAPEVPTSYQARFEVVDTTNKKSMTLLQQGKSAEADLRVSTVIPYFMDQLDDSKARQAMAGSWAAKMLARHPHSKAVTVYFDEYHLPTMKDYRQGELAKWETIYRATFEKTRDEGMKKGIQK